MFVFVLVTVLGIGLPAVATSAATSGPQGVAHRGYWQKYEEETADALRGAINLGLCNEVDIHLTKDNVPVLIHDPTVDRTLSGTGRVRDFTAEQFLAMTTPKGRHPITLATAIDITRSMGGCMMVEVWPGYWNASRYAAMGRLVQSTDQIWFDSYRREVLANMNAAAPSLKLAWKTRDAVYSPSNLPGYIDVVISDDSTASMVRAHHAAGIQVWRERAKESTWNTLNSQGVDKIYTNAPLTYSQHQW